MVHSPPRLTPEVQLVPIYLLNDDLLLVIFHLLDLKDRIRITHVSRRLRQIGMDSSLLWAAPDFTLPELASEMLLRSKSAPLSIIVPNGDRPVDGDLLWDAIEQRMDVIQLLHLELEHEQRDQTAQDMRERLVAPGAALMFLSIISPYPLPRNYHKNNARALKSLKLEVPFTSWSWKSPMLQENLTFLSLDNTAGPQRYGCVSGLHDALNKMSHLQVLRISDCLPRGEPTPTTSAHLPHLCRLTLISIGTQDSYNILTTLSFPSSTAVFVHGGFLVPQDKDQALKAMEAAIIYMFPAGDSVVDSLQLGLADMTIFQLKAWTETLYFGSDALHIPPRLCLQMKWFIPPDEFYSDTVIKAAIEVLPLQQLRFLDMRVADGIVDDSIVPKFGPLPKLSCIMAEGESGHDFVGVFEDWGALSEPMAESGVGMVFPALETFAVRGLDFSVDYCYDRLLDALEQRSRRGRKLQGLWVRESINFFEHSVDEFEEVVENVVWDGVEITPEDSGSDVADDERVDPGDGEDELDDDDF
uniref:F-box domain-containing protein n=1 Tax=Moniliophthora roreri TaxID=221103 RepID=A0A0W0FRX4_MONRR